MPTPPHPRLALLNFAIFTALAGFVVFWVYYYTNLPQSVAAVTALAGTVSYMGLIPEDRKKQWQETFDSVILSNKFSTWIVVLIFVGLIGAASARGGVELRTVGDSIERLVTVIEPGVSESTYRLAPGERLRINKYVPMLSAREYIVKIDGLPLRKIEFRPWQRPVLTVPQSFRRPVLLLVPDQHLITQLSDDKREFSIDIKLEGRRSEQCTADYRPTSMWIGAPETMQIPEDMRQITRRGIDARSTWAVDKVFSPRGCEHLEPSADAKVDISVRSANGGSSGKPFSRKQFHVQSWKMSPSLIQVETLPWGSQ
jgi:hypothetical protein